MSTTPIAAAELSALVEILNPLLSSKIAKRDPIQPFALAAFLSDGEVKIERIESLTPRLLLDRPNASRHIDAALRATGADVVAVAYEGWMRLVPGADAEQTAKRFGHLVHGADGRAEVLTIDLRGADFQTMVVHGIKRLGKRRVLVLGPCLFEGLTMGGALARCAPTRH